METLLPHSKVSLVSMAAFIVAYKLLIKIGFLGLVEWFKCEALSSNPSTTTKKKENWLLPYPNAAFPLIE
jgi:hypothetical protein